MHLKNQLFNRQPITPGLHGLIDYGFGLVSVTIPALLGLTGSARVIPVLWAVGQGTLNAFTDQPYAVKRIIPFSTHGRAETIGLPTLFAVTAASGALKHPRARVFFASLFAALLTNYVLTDYDATPEPAK